MACFPEVGTPLCAPRSRVRVEAARRGCRPYLPAAGPATEARGPLIVAGPALGGAWALEAKARVRRTRGRSAELACLVGLASASIYSKFRSTPCGSGAVRRVEVSLEAPRLTHRPAMGRSADSPRQLGIALGAIGASDQFHILMGGHPTVFVKKQEGGPCDHLTLS